AGHQTGVSGRFALNAAILRRRLPARALDVGAVKDVLPTLVDGDAGGGGDATNCGQNSQFKHATTPCPEVADGAENVKWKPPLS
ncbi:MAG: hypothetical protein E6848_37750, partial [Bradyrhizobium sp.]|nr:hypothetical protein [Bradyrhizobium sp.]